MTKYKYYLKQPKNMIVKDILYWLMAGGVVVSAIVAPGALRGVVPILKRLYPERRYNSTYTAFRRLLKDGSIHVRKEGKQIYISLTAKGRKKAGLFQINDLKIKKPKRWDGKWRVIIFDISQRDRIIRETLRGFLKRLDFHQLQKSVWIYPYECRDEIELIKNFFGLTLSDMRLIVTRDIGGDKLLRRGFKL